MDPGLSTSAPTDTSTAVSVLLPLPLVAPYDYLVPAEMEVEPGSYVEVPLGARRVTGVVWGAAHGDVDEQKLREISVLIDLPPMPQNLRLFVDWVAGYTLSRLGSVLRMTMSVPRALEPPRVTTVYRLAPGLDAKSESLPGDLRLTDARKRVFNAIGDGRLYPSAEISKMAHTSASVVRGMVDAGL